MIDAAVARVGWAVLGLAIAATIAAPSRSSGSSGSSCSSTEQRFTAGFLIVLEAARTHAEYVALEPLVGEDKAAFCTVSTGPAYADIEWEIAFARQLREVDTWIESLRHQAPGQRPICLEVMRGQLIRRLQLHALFRREDYKVEYEQARLERLDHELDLIGEHIDDAIADIDIARRRTCASAPCLLEHEGHE